MKLITLLASVAALATLGVTVQAQAGTIPYPNAGTPNPQTYSFTAQSSSDLIGYFYGSDARLEDVVGVLDNGVLTSGGFGLDNHTSTAGQSFDFGKVTAGDTLVFVLDVLDSNHMLTSSEIYSDPSQNTAYDHSGITNHDHVYSTDFSGNSTVPAGTYVGFEDRAYDTDYFKGADYDYNDEQFVFKNASVSAAPEPSSWTLMIAGVGAAGLMLRRRHNSAMIAAAA